MRGLNLSLWSVTNPAVTLFLILVALAAGAMAYLSLGRAEDPTFTIKTMVVQAVWPGATAEQMQNLVAEPIEKRIQELPELDYVRTFSRPGATVIQVQLKDDVRVAAPVWYQVRKKIDDLRPALPDGLIGPFFDDEYGDVFSAIYLLTGEGLGRADLKAYAERLRTRLLAVEGAAKVALIGEVEERVFVEVSHRRLATLGLSAPAIFAAIAAQNDLAAAGSVATAADAVRIRVSGGLADLQGLRDLPLSAGGTVLRLGDIATVRRGYEDPPHYLAFLNGQETVGVGVAMAAGANVVQLGDVLAAEIAAFRADLPLGVEVTQIADQAGIVADAFNEFIVTFVEALVIVLAVSFVTLGLRTGIVVALSVPIVLAVVFVVMQVMGLNFDRITLGALIVALGLLVDDAIIAVEMMVVKIAEGYDRIAAASAAWSSTAFPMLTGTLVTAAGFLPVGFARSTSGEYAGNIFWVVAVALIASWVVAVVVTPYLGMKLLPAPRPGADHRDVHDGRLYRLLRRGVEASLRARWWVIGATVAALGLTVVGMGQVQQQFFPTSARAELFIETRMPEGSSIEATTEAALAAAALVGEDPDALYASTYVGAGAPRFFFALNPALPNPSFAMTVIMARDAAARDRLRAKIEAAVAAGAVPQARVRVDQIVFGPPVGFPVQFRVIGPDPAEVRRFAAEVREVMVANPDTVEPQFDWNEQAKTVGVRLDQHRIRALGLNSADVANTLQTLISGVKVSEYREGTELIDVVVRAPAAERADPAALGDLSVPLPGGGAVPLSHLAVVTYGFEEPILWRRNREMALTVRADVAPGVQAPTVTAALLLALQPVIDRLAAGYRIETGGAVEESAKANGALFKVFPLMFLTMLTLLMLQLRSFAKLFLVFLTAPLGAIGAVAALLLFNAPFGFVALLGVIALAGMIMRNTVILVDQIDHDLAAGSPTWQAIVDSTVRRARPVVLTALAAILAMIPLARSVFWGPMALSIMGGLIVATVLTLFFLPALYAAWFRVRRETDAAGRAVRSSADVLVLTPDALRYRLAGE
jgi:multidrug efflux pump subunit AcrB